MIFLLSIICCFGSLVICPIILLLNKVNLGITLLITILVFCFFLALYSILILILLPLLGKHYAKTSDYKDLKRWRFMIDVAKFSCFWLGIKVKISGLEKIDQNKKLVFYSNHQSFIDPLIYYTALKNFPHGTMYKESINKMTLAAPMAKALGGVAIKREDDRKALEAVITIIKRIKDGLNFFIYPEGTRSKGIGMHHFKAGSFKIAQKSGADLVILTIDGSYRKRLVIPFVYTPVYIRVCKVLSNEEINNYQTTDLASLAEKVVHDNLIDIRKTHHEMRISPNLMIKFIEQQKNDDVFL